MADFSVRFPLTLFCGVFIFGMEPVSAASNDQSGNPKNKSAASIKYYLPKTNASLTANLVLRECGPIPKAKPTLVVATTAGADKEAVFAISGPTLSSWRVKQDLTIKLHDTGTISSINSTVEDRTGSIFGGLLKFVASIFLPVKSEEEFPVSGYICNGKTQAAIDEVKTLEKKIAELRVSIPNQSAAEVKAAVEAINVLAQRIAALRTGPLRLEYKAKIDLSAPTGTERRDISPKEGNLSKWFEKPKVIDEKIVAAAKKGMSPGLTNPEIEEKLKETLPAFKLNYTLSAVTKSESNRNTETAKSEVDLGCPQDVDCDRSLVFREPVMARLTINGPAGWVGISPDGKLYEATIPIAQWGELSFLRLSAKVLQKRTVDLAFDKFGRKTSFAWKSEAKGDTLAGALGGASETVTAIRTGLKGKTDAEKDAALATELETQQKLNKFLACQEILDAGGFACPGGE